MAPSEAHPILIISHDIVGTQMAGPGIRYWHLANVLGQHFPVTLAIPTSSTRESSPEFIIIAYESWADNTFIDVVRKASAVLIPAISYAALPILSELSVPVIIDGYNPFVAESLIYKNTDLDALQSQLTQAYLAGDFFICASERQRDWWLGILEAHGRINRLNVQQDASLRNLIDVVPYGLPKAAPQHTRAVIKGVWPGIEPDDQVILWGGGLWPWLDPLTAIRAVAQVWTQRQDVRLIFPGTRHPNPGMADISTHTEAAQQLAADLGLLDKAIFFGDWVPYVDWPNVLRESNLALTLHFDTLETRLAFRSRVLDYIWAKLPIIATAGDATSDLVAAHNIGHVVDFEAVEQVAAAILQCLDIPRESMQSNFDDASKALTWDMVARPLIQFCLQPYLAADKGTNNQTPGNPYYHHRLNSLQTLINAYEQGRFIRFMRWLRR